MEATKETNGPIAALSGAPPIVLCTQPNCTEPATHAYHWAWGEKGFCCSSHMFLLQQTATQIERTIQFAPIVEGGTPPVDRPERIALTARALAAEAETEEARSRGLDLYRQNTQLTAQIQSLTIRNREAEAQAAHAQKTATELDAKNRALQSENASLADELARVKVLTGMDDATIIAGSTRAELGLSEETTEVSGKTSKKHR